MALDKLSKLDSKLSDIWNYFRTMSDGWRQTESLDPYQDRQNIGPDPVPNGLQRLSADEKSGH